MNILVLGGDGFCGWPTALKLSKAGHNVHIIDNLTRRVADSELESNSLTNISSFATRLHVANECDMHITAEIYDAKNDELLNTILQYEIDTIVHFAEQRSAPYSMLGDSQRKYTVENNIAVTNNVLSKIVESGRDIHLVHLGTMGVYGYSKEFGKIPEGYLNVKVNSTQNDIDILYPTNPGSIYHMTKSLDQILFQFYNKNWGLKITDLHQGIVWGTQTKETKLAPELVNRFDYDGIYGTVLNRFISQAAAGHPITVYGSGGQKRAFIHIEDTAKCVQLACENRPEIDKVRIFNQVSEVQEINQLAKYIAEQYDGDVLYYENPRKELAENDLEVENEGLRSLGFNPITLKKHLIEDVYFIAKEYKERLKEENVMTSPQW